MKEQTVKLKAMLVGVAALAAPTKTFVKNSIETSMSVSNFSSPSSEGLNGNGHLGKLPAAGVKIFLTSDSFRHDQSRTRQFFLALDSNSCFYYGSATCSPRMLLIQDL